VGTVTNRSPGPIQDLTVYSSDGDTVQRADLVRWLPAGATTRVDAPIQLDPATQQASGTTLLRSVALAGIAAGDGSVLTGFTATTPSGLKVDGEVPQPASVGVLQQPVAIEAADGFLRYFESRRLASSNGESGTGFQDTYDIVLPHTSASLALRYSAELSADLEIYDFALGRFVKVSPPAGTGLSMAPVSSSQVSDGLVRVRFREARLFQGSSVWVDSTTP
jgi:hypothetical protein